MTQLVLVAHGSRDPRFAATAERVRDAVSARLPGVAVSLGYLDIDRPLIGDVLAAAGTDAVAVPLLLSAGYHSKVDLPAIIATHNSSVAQTPVLGSHALVTALTDRLTEAGMTDRDGVILCAVGSSDPHADTHVRRRAIELSTRMHRPVEVVFATKLGPHDRAVRVALRRLHAAGAERIVVSPYFLSAGTLTERVEAALDRLAPDSLVAGPLGAHPDVVGAVCALYRNCAHDQWVTT